MLTRLPWDSEFFGFNVGYWRSSTASPEDVDALKKEARREGIRLIYWFAPEDSEVDDVAQVAGAALMDRKVTFVARVPQGGVAMHKCISQTKEKTEALLSLALQSGAYSRFRLDERLPTGSFERMYTQWLERSLTGNLAREVLVFRDQDEELGFLTIGTKHGRVDIGLLAVDSAAAGRGIGAALVNAALARATTWGYSQVQVVTQEQNNPACRLYSRCGFTGESVERVYHLWM